MRVEDIKTNRRFKRADHVLYSEAKNGIRLYFYPIKDIAYSYTLYYFHLGFQSCLLYGPDNMKSLDINQTQQFIAEHNRHMLKQIITIQKDKELGISDDPMRFGELDSYWLIDGLIVYKDSLTELRNDMVSE